LFNTAKVLTVTSTSAIRTMTKGLFITTSGRPLSSAEFSSFRNEPRVNDLPLRRSKKSCIAVRRRIIGSGY
jgi:hypothetical protein